MIFIYLALTLSFDIKHPEIYGFQKMLQETTEQRAERELARLAITDPAAYVEELKRQGRFPVDLDEYLKRKR